MKKTFFSSKYFFFILILAGIFFFVYSFWGWQLSQRGSLKFNSPDETANYFFARQEIEQSCLRAFTPLAASFVHPRAILKRGHYLEPVSFLGLPFYAGWWGKIFGQRAILFFTPFWAALAVIFYYLFWEKFLGEQKAFWASLLLFFCPPYWYYASRGLYHNAAAAAFFIISAFFLSRERGFWAGLFLGLAVAFRSTFLLWLAIGGLFLFFLLPQKPKKSFWPFFGLGFILPLLPILRENFLLYGHYLATGYNYVVKASPTTPPLASAAFFPFGFHFWLIGENFLHYFWQLNWFYFVPATLGLVVWWRQEKSVAGKLVLKVFLLAAAILIFYYGPSRIKDDIGPDQVTLGNSFNRYWLLLYVFSLPAIVFFWEKIKNLFSISPFKKQIFFGLVIFFTLFLAFERVVKKGPDSLARVQQRLFQEQQLCRAAQKKLPAKAIIATFYGDKIFFPEFSVAALPLEQINKLPFWQKKVAGYPIFYYNSLLSGQDVAYLNKKVFLPQGYFLQPKGEHFFLLKKF